ELERKGALLGRAGVGEEHNLVEVVAVRLVELLQQRDEVELAPGREPLADGAAAAANRRPRRRADVDRGEDAGRARRDADDRAGARHGGAVDEIDRPVRGEADL